MDISRGHFIQKSGMSLLGAAVIMNTGSMAFANPSAPPFKPIRFAVISDLHRDIKRKISPEQVSWKTPMVSVGEAKHLEAREALLNATW